MLKQLMTIPHLKINVTLEKILKFTTKEKLKTKHQQKS